VVPYYVKFTQGIDDIWQHVHLLECEGSRASSSAKAVIAANSKYEQHKYRKCSWMKLKHFIACIVAGHSSGNTAGFHTLHSLPLLVRQAAKKRMNSIMLCQGLGHDVYELNRLLLLDWKPYALERLHCTLFTTADCVGAMTWINSLYGFVFSEFDDFPSNDLFEPRD